MMSGIQSLTFSIYETNKVKTDKFSQLIVKMSDKKLNFPFEYRRERCMVATAIAVFIQ